MKTVIMGTAYPFHAHFRPETHIKNHVLHFHVYAPSMLYARLFATQNARGEVAQDVAHPRSLYAANLFICCFVSLLYIHASRYIWKRTTTTRWMHNERNKTTNTKRNMHTSISHTRDVHHINIAYTKNICIIHIILFLSGGDRTVAAQGRPDQHARRGRQREGIKVMHRTSHKPSQTSESISRVRRQRREKTSSKHNIPNEIQGPGEKETKCMISARHTTKSFRRAPEGFHFACPVAFLQKTLLNKRAGQDYLRR